MAVHSRETAVLELVRDLTRHFNDPLVRNTIWGVHIRSLASGETVYAINDRTLLLPVSSMKLVTLAAAAALGIRPFGAPSPSPSTWKTLRMWTRTRSATGHDS